MRFALGFLTTLVAAAVLQQPANGQHVTGGYAPTPLTDELRELLVKALGDTKVYGESVKARLCVVPADITAVEQQVVAGMNYRFTTSACDLAKTSTLQGSDGAQGVGKCSSGLEKKCARVDAVVTVYQKFDDSVSVSAITVSEAPTKPTEPAKPAGVHAADM